MFVPCHLWKAHYGVLRCLPRTNWRWYGGSAVAAWRTWENTQPEDGFAWKPEDLFYKTARQATVVSWVYKKVHFYQSPAVGKSVLSITPHSTKCFGREIRTGTQRIGPSKTGTVCRFEIQWDRLVRRSSESCSSELPRSTCIPHLLPQQRIKHYLEPGCDCQD